MRRGSEAEMSKIVTEFVYPPIPFRGMDWRAYFDGEEEDGPYGQGESEADAILSLCEAADIPEPASAIEWLSSAKVTALLAAYKREE